MQKRHRWVLAGLAAVLVFIVIAFPAGLAYRWFAPPELRLSGINGSVWRGHAVEGAATDIYIRNLQWNFRPTALLSGKIAFRSHAELAGGFIDADLAVSPGGAVILSNMTGDIALQAFKESFQLEGFEGRLALDFERMKIVDGVPVEAVGSLAVEGLRAPRLSNAPIGDYHAEFDSGPDGISGTVADQSGVFDLDGKILVDANRAYSFIGRIAASPQAPAALRQQLEFLGSPDEQGRREFRIEGQF